MPGIYRLRHPERTVLYRVLFHHFERFVAEYESRFERETMDYLEFIARVVSHIPDKGQVTVRSGGLQVLRNEDVAGGPISRQFSGS